MVSWVPNASADDNRTDKPTVVLSAGSCGRDGAEDPGKQKFCETATERNTGATVICVAADDGCMKVINPISPDLGTMIPPNRSIVVVVAQPTHRLGILDVSIALNGTSGISLPSTFTGMTAEKFAAGSEPLISPADAVYIARFAPRTKGPMTLTVAVTQAATPTITSDEAARVKAEIEKELVPIRTTLDALQKQPILECEFAICGIVAGPPSPEKKPDEPTSKTTTKTYAYELFAPEVFGGAVRIGFGVIHVDDLAHSYGTRKLAGTDFSHVVDNGASPYAAELVVGYAPFLFHKCNATGGRTYASYENRWLRFAPYFGVGVLSSSPSVTKVDYLRSFYFGIEYELTVGSSIAPAFIVRRVDAPATGLAPGQTIDPSVSPLTRTTFTYGFGLVFSVTPAFFQVASSAVPK